MKTLLALIVASFLSGSALAEVYQWTDERGKVHYSSAPPHPGAKPAELPAITREKSKPIPTTQSCAKHGGIDCQKGEDADGSVICFDGYKDATARFRFSCNSAKLEITDISETRPDGSFSVFIRNTSSVAAKSAKVLLRSVEGKEIPGSGPGEVEPLGIGEFTFATSLPGGQKPAIDNFHVACENCG